MANKEPVKKQFFLIRWAKSFANYIVSSYKELKKVSWPTGKELLKNTWIVILVVIVFGAFVFAMDTIFSLLKGLIDGFIG